MHPGWAAHAGIAAATLAESGFAGPATVLEGRRGLFASHLGETAQVSALDLDSLGRKWMAKDIALKPYPCCHFTHAFIDAAEASDGARAEEQRFGEARLSGPAMAEQADVFDGRGGVRLHGRLSIVDVIDGGVTGPRL